MVNKQPTLRPGSVVVVTGGSAGVGRAIVRAFAEAGCDVAVLARGRDGLDGAVRDVEKLGRRGLGISTDVADADAVERAASQVETELGPIDIWVNNAFASVLAPADGTTVEEFERATRVTYFGQVNGTRAALKRMKPRDRGHVIQIGSALAFRGIPLQSAYCGAKRAVVGYTESVITELRHDKSGVDVSLVHLPALNTPQFSWVLSKMPSHPQPVPPIYQPEVAAKGVLHVAKHPGRRTMWIGLPTFGTILGNRFAPRLLDAYLGRTGYDSQQQPDDTNPMLGPNLYEPVAGDHGAHGDFDGDAHDHSVGLWLTMHRSLAVGAAAAVAGAAAALVARQTD